MFVFIFVVYGVNRRALKDCCEDYGNGHGRDEDDSTEDDVSDIGEESQIQQTY